MSEEIWDVIVVGAGLSGLSAAHLLKKRDAKLKILILEGKDRVGGRTLSFDIPAANGKDRWDLGGQWVGRTQTHVLELIEELGLEMYPQFNSGKKVHHMGGAESRVKTYTSSLPTLNPLVLLDLSLFIYKIDRLSATVNIDNPSLTPNASELDSMTLHSYLEQNAWTRELKEDMAMATRAVFGVEPCYMSMLFFVMYSASAGGLLALLESTPGAGQELKIKGGTQQLSEGLAERVGRESVRLGCAVRAIWQDSEGARVHTATGEILRCRAVIVSCPPHLAAKIDYEPPLPTQRESLTQRMPIGHMIKFVVTYKKAFWKDRGFSGEIVTGASTGCPFCVTFDATTSNGNAALVGFISAQQATYWTTKEATERRKAVVSSLVQYLGSEAASFIHYEEKDWGKEEFSGGCPVSVMAPGLLMFFHPSLRMPCGRIHWAGTETATLWCGYMSGAVQSGHRAAREILHALCPSVLSEEEKEEVKRSYSIQSPPQPKTKRSLVGVKTVVGAALVLGAALFLRWRPEVLDKVKEHLPNMFSVQ